MTETSLVIRVRDWLAENWTPGGSQEDSVSWRRMVHAAGFAVPGWPVELGGLGLDADEEKLVEGEFKKAGVPGSGQDRTNIAANTVRLYGTDKAHADHLDDLVTGAALSCLLYSEPGAGSDLAAVRTRAVREGDHYRVNGQKVWTSRAAESTYGLLLARTDWDIPKHGGLSFFIIPMKQSGIEIRAINQINGESHFNEVFLDDALVPAEYLLSTEGDGWRVMTAALAYERLIMAEGAAERSKNGQDPGTDLVAMARRHGRLTDPCLRQEIAQAVAWRRIGELNAARTKRTAAAGGSTPLMSLGKLAMSRVLHNDARVMRKIVGAATLIDADCADAQDVNFRTMHAYMNSIGGGTDQIQRNIIAERVLGLPREIEVDRDIAFRDSLAARSCGS